MAWRLDEHILGGYLNFTSPRSIHGVLFLAGAEIPLSLSLLGDAEPSLAGRALEFEARTKARVKRCDFVAQLSPQQPGSAGTIRFHMVKALPPGMTIEELMEADEEPEFPLRPCLTVEWHGPNGRAQFQLADPRIEVTEGPPLDEPELSPVAPAAGLRVTIVQIDPDGQPTAARFRTKSDEDIDESLEAYLDRQRRETEAAYRENPQDPAAFLEEMNELERDLAHGDHELAHSVLEPRRLPPPYDTTEEQAQTLVRTIAVELAMSGIAFHLCPHYAWKRAYEFLLEEVLPKVRVRPSIRARKGTWNVDTGEQCEECSRENAERFRTRPTES